MEVIDDLDRRVVLEEMPVRIISLSPSNTEILFAINAGDRVVGVTEYTNYPQEATEITKVGSSQEINLEQIIALQPDFEALKYYWFTNFKQCPLFVP